MHIVRFRERVCTMVERHVSFQQKLMPRFLLLMPFLSHSISRWAVTGFRKCSSEIHWLNSNTHTRYSSGNRVMGIVVKCTWRVAGHSTPSDQQRTLFFLRRRLPSFVYGLWHYYGYRSSPFLFPPPIFSSGNFLLKEHPVHDCSHSRSRGYLLLQ